MLTEISASLQDGSEHVAQKGTLIYRGKKEVSTIAIKNNCFEISEILNDGKNISFQLKNLSTGQYELTKFSELYSQRLEADEHLIFADNFDELTKKISEIQPPLPNLPESTIPKCLLSKAEENITKNNSIDLLINELEKNYKSQGIKMGFRQLLMQACLRYNDQHNYKFGIHPSTYYKNKKQLELYQFDIKQYASSLHRSSFNQTRFSATTLCFLDVIIETYICGDEYRCNQEHVYTKIIPCILNRTGNKWINPEKCKNKIPADFVEEILNPDIPFEILLNNQEKTSLLSDVHLPSRTSFYNYVRQFKADKNQTEKQFRERYGDEFFENTILVFDSYIYKAMYPLHYVFADHCLLDIFIVDEQTRSEPFKVWFTALIDAKTRCILGISLSEKSPCIESIQTALKHAIWPKEQWLEKNNIDSNLSWECFGIPVNLSLDNAWAHHSISLKNVVNRLGFNGQYTKTTLIFRPPYKGRYGALVERYFGNIQGQIKELLKGAVKDREFVSIQSAKREACLLYSDLLASIVKLIDAYHHEPHSELDGLTPIQKWMEGIEAHLPIIPLQTNDNERLFWRSWHDSRVILRDGIHLFNMTYSSPGLSKAQIVDWDRKKVEYGVSFDVDDISTLALFQNNKFVCDVKSKKLRIGTAEWLKFSLTELKIAREMSKQKFNTPTKWMECFYDFKEINERRTKEKKEFNRKGSLPKKQSDENKKRQENGEPKINQHKGELTRLVANFVKKSKRSN